MEIEISKYKIFTYRNSPALRFFSPTEKYLYTVTADRIIQTELHSNLNIACGISFEPVSILLHSDMIYIAAKDKFYYFDGDLVYLQPREPLSHNFLFKQYIITVDQQNIQFFNTKTKIKEHSVQLLSPKYYKTSKSDPTRNLELADKSRINHKNGICSSSTVVGETVYLGFENGAVYEIDMFERLLQLQEVVLVPEINNSFDDQTERLKITSDGFDQSLTSKKSFQEDPNIKCLIYTKEPIISLKHSNGSVFLSTIKSQIIKVYSKKGTEICKRLPEYARKLERYKEMIIFFSEAAVVFMNSNLKVLAIHRSDFNILGIEISESKLFIGYSNSLIIEHDMDKVYHQIKAHH